jgi:hypothetical protein
MSATWLELAAFEMARAGCRSRSMLMTVRPSCCRDAAAVASSSAARRVSAASVAAAIASDSAPDTNALSTAAIVRNSSSVRP